MSDNEIARRCGVTQPFVSSVRKELAATNNSYKSRFRKGADGRTIDTSNIGKPKPAPPAPAPGLFADCPAEAAAQQSVEATEPEADEEEPEDEPDPGWPAEYEPGETGEYERDDAPFGPEPAAPAGPPDDPESGQEIDGHNSEEGEPGADNRHVVPVPAPPGQRPRDAGPPPAARRPRPSGPIVIDRKDQPAFPPEEGERREFGPWQDKYCEIVFVFRWVQNLGGIEGSTQGWTAEEYSDLANKLDYLNRVLFPLVPQWVTYLRSRS